MFELVNLTFAAIIISCLLIAAAGRLKNCLYTAAAQGLLVSLVPLITAGLKLEVIILAAAGILIKMLLLPLMILNSIREARVRREIEPKISYPLSILFSMGGLLMSLWLVSKLPLTGTDGVTHLMVVTPFFMIFTGLFLLISRLKAITGVIGLLIFGNGIYLFGGLLSLHHNMVVEFGLFLDALVALCAYGVAKFSINRSFDHIDVSHVSGLADVMEMEEEEG